MQGTTKWFNNQKGYGFITDSEGKDVFVHHSNIVMDGFRHLNEDDIVNYELGAGSKRQAISHTENDKGFSERRKSVCGDNEGCKWYNKVSCG